MEGEGARGCSAAGHQPCAAPGPPPRPSPHGHHHLPRPAASSLVLLAPARRPPQRTSYRAPRPLPGRLGGGVSGPAGVVGGTQIPSPTSGRCAGPGLHSTPAPYRSRALTPAAPGPAEACPTDPPASLGPASVPASILGYSPGSPSTGHLPSVRSARPEAKATPLLLRGSPGGLGWGLRGLRPRAGAAAGLGLAPGLGPRAQAGAGRCVRAGQATRAGGREEPRLAPRTLQFSAPRQMALSCHRRPTQAAGSAARLPGERAPRPCGPSVETRPELRREGGPPGWPSQRLPSAAKARPIRKDSEWADREIQARPDLETPVP
ncbi:skin secretory protein xP2 [Trichechus manatus latirostris]|uniref:Skin secretory protein xP2 n=1 Tax=Trichechus manatus latirostris TaxID=127582 RepID=A0A2Y9G5V5_TRIMA|nr:skin secretory protein xP2 [Trichechus manatus latirostris]